MPGQQQVEADPYAEFGVAAAGAGAKDPYSEFAQAPAPPEPKPKPGFFTRLGQSLGVPTSKTEYEQIAAKEQSLPWYKQIIPHMPGQEPGIGDVLAGPGAAQLGRMVKNYGQTAVKGIQEGGQQALEAREQLGRGDINMKQAAGKGADAMLHAGLQATPIIGPSIETAGEDVAGGNYAGAAGGLTGVIGQVAAPELIRRGGPPVIRGVARGTNAVLQKAPGVIGSGIGAAVGSQVGHPGLGAAAGYAVGRDLLPKLRVPGERFGLLPEGYTPGGVPPTGPNPEPISTPYRMAGEAVPEARTATPRTVAPINRQLRAAPPEGLPAPESPAPAPYRMRGAQIPEAATATPRVITPVSRQLPAAPAEVPPEPQPSPLKAKTPQAAQTEIFKKMGVAAPKASLKPMESIPAAEQRPAPWMTFGNRALAGESAARMQLTHTSQNALRSMAMERGIKVTPQMTSQHLQNAIAETLTPEEIQSFENAALERMQPDYSVKPTGETGVPSPAGPMTKGTDLIEGLKQMKSAKQGGHAGGGVISAEEANRAGTNYVVSKSGQITHHGKQFAPEATRPGSTHVTVMPDGSFRVNAGQKLTAAQESALRNALKK